jgi:hypothetical protein
MRLHPLTWVSYLYFAILKALLNEVMDRCENNKNIKQNCKDSAKPLAMQMKRQPSFSDSFQTDWNYNKKQKYEDPINKYDKPNNSKSTSVKSDATRSAPVKKQFVALDLDEDNDDDLVYLQSFNIDEFSKPKESVVSQKKVQSFGVNNKHSNCNDAVGVMDDDDDLLYLQSINIDQFSLPKKEAKVPCSNMKNKNNCNNDDDDNDDLAYLPVIEKFTATKTNRIKPKEPFNSDDDDFLVIKKITNETRTPLAFTVSEPEIVQSPVFKMVSLIDLVSKQFDCCLSKERTHCVHIVKGFVKTLSSAVKISEMKWQQTCIISDGSDSLDVKIDNSVMNDLIEMTPEDAKQLFLSMKANPKATLIYQQKCDLFKQKVMNLCCLIHLKYDMSAKKFCIFKLENIDQSYFDYLYGKLKKSL